MKTVRMHLALLLALAHAAAASGDVETSLVLLQRHADAKLASPSSDEAHRRCDFDFRVEGVGVMTGPQTGKCVNLEAYPESQTQCQVSHVVPDQEGNYIVGFSNGGLFKMTKIDASGERISNSCKWVIAAPPCSPDDMLDFYAKGYASGDGYTFIKDDGFSCNAKHPKQSWQGCNFGFRVEGIGYMTGPQSGTCVNNPESQCVCQITHVVPDQEGGYIAGYWNGNLFKMTKVDASGERTPGTSKWVAAAPPYSADEMFDFYEKGTPIGDGYIFVQGDGFSCRTNDAAPTPAPASEEEYNEKEEEGEIVRDRNKDGKRCRSTDRVMDLKDDDASLEGCSRVCRKNPDCMAFSGRAGKRCIGCKRPLDEDDPDGSEAFIKKRCMLRCRNKARMGPEGERCNRPECNACAECPA